MKNCHYITRTKSKFRSGMSTLAAPPYFLHHPTWKRETLTAIDNESWSECRSGPREFMPLRTLGGIKGVQALITGHVGAEKHGLRSRLQNIRVFSVTGGTVERSAGSMSWQQAFPP